ncbi:PREDICTED: calpain-14 [Ceratotherium simum simum]|uniref:Calpain-14 n=1 Tax=Ceratotherium simum simum TaxID=73337 RepID=A0ABM0H386_CERSS|nr:PREDICTED: calpain-14 [Ceratotherium simum simum]
MYLCSGSWKLGRKNPARGSAQLPKQDYEALQERCLRDGRLFEDSSFPATLSSIGRGSLLQKLPHRLQWRRPPELHSNAQFYCAKAKRLDLCQGVVGDCWFLAALQALTLHQDILKRVVPLNQSFTQKYAGIFQFWFWHFGKWVPVVIDDRLPVNEAGQLVFVSSTYKNLFWGALLEKAYAKLSGSYEDLQLGQVSEALVDFTGGVTVTINLAEAPGNLWDILTQAAYNRTLIGCQTHSGKEKVLENGLVGGHAYTLTGIREVTCKHGPEYLVKLRNPWGKVEWKGAWSDSSSTWELLSPTEKILLLRKDDDGEFWMTLKDFKAHFMALVICKLTPGLLSQEVGQKWAYTMREGRWEKGTTAGGQMKFPRDTFWRNPQFLLSVWRPQEGRRAHMPCSVLVSLLQKPRHRHRNCKPHLAIGFYLFRVNKYYDGQRRLPPEFFWKNAPLSWPEPFCTQREVSRELWLEPGMYLVVPCTSEAHQESEFVLRVFSRKHVFYEVGSSSSAVFSKEIVDQNEGQDEFSTKFFEEHPEINAAQLQKILNRVTWSRLGTTQPLFSLDACQGILALLDLNESGTMNIQEFRDLRKQLTLYQEVFHKQDSNRSGCLDWAQLRAAMREAGIVLSDDVCQLLLIRYGDPSLQMDFVSFVHLMLRAEKMEDVFQNLTQDGKGIYLQKPEEEILRAIKGGLQGVAANLLESHSEVLSDTIGNFTIIIFIITSSSSIILISSQFPSRRQRASRRRRQRWCGKHLGGHRANLAGAGVQLGCPSALPCRAAGRLAPPTSTPACFSPKRERRLAASRRLSTRIPRLKLPGARRSLGLLPRRP